MVEGTILLGKNARVRIAGRRLGSTLHIANMNYPEAGITKLQMRKEPVLATSLLSHPALEGFSGEIVSIHNNGSSLEMELQPQLTTLAPVPDPAIQWAPARFDPAAPWDLTVGEAQRLTQLVQELASA